MAAPTDRATLVAAGGVSAEVALDELLETSLLESSGPPTDEARRYELHAVTRSFVRAHLPLAPGPERRALARLDALDVEIVSASAGMGSSVEGIPSGPSVSTLLAMNVPWLKDGVTIEMVGAFGGSAARRRYR